jgi:hypothetical protein
MMSAIQAFGKRPCLIEDAAFTAAQKFGAEKRQQYMAKFNIGCEQMVIGVLSKRLVKLDLDQRGQSLLEPFMLATRKGMRGNIDGSILRCWGGRTSEWMMCSSSGSTIAAGGGLVWSKGD